MHAGENLGEYQSLPGANSIFTPMGGARGLPSVCYSTAMSAPMMEELVRHKWHANAAYLAEANQHAAARQDEELRTLLHHILVANRFWLFLTVGIEFDREMEARVPPSLDALIARYRETEAIEMEWLARCDEAELARELTTARLPGKAFTVAQALMQIALHSHGHRAQAALRLRSLGGTPPRSDFILWTIDRPAPEWPEPLNSPEA